MTRKYTVFFDGPHATVEVGDRHRAYRLTAVDCTDPRRSFQTAIFTHDDAHGWLVMAAAMMADSAVTADHDVEMMKAFACQLELQGPAPVTYTAQELLMFACGYQWRCVQESEEGETPPSPPLTEGGF